LHLNSEAISAQGSRLESNATQQIMAYLRKEKLLIEADVFTPAAPNTPATQTPKGFTVNLYDNIRWLKLDVDQIAPLHGRLVTMEDLLKSIGRAG
jgi:hypothetical protein